MDVNVLIYILHKVYIVDYQAVFMGPDKFSLEVRLYLSYVLNMLLLFYYMG
jgi:hypothetical protein